MDPFHENYRDEGIDLLEKRLLEYNILIEPFLKNGSKDDFSITERKKLEKLKKKRYFWWLINQILMATAYLRYAALVVTCLTGNQFLSAILGDTFGTLGPTFRVVIYASILGEATFSIGINFVTHYFERHNLLDCFKDLKSLQGLSPDNYRLFKSVSRFLSFVAPNLITFNHVLFATIYTIGIYRHYLLTNLHESASQNLSEATSFVVAIFLLWFSCRYMSAAFYLTIPFMNMSTIYLVMRFNQINDSLDSILHAETLKLNVQLINNFIHVHGLLTSKVLNYNRVMKWYLIIAHYTLGGVLGLVIFALIAADHESIAAPTFLVINIFGIGTLMTIINGFASMINTVAMKSHHKLNIIFVAYGRFYDYQTRNQLIQLMESISSQYFPISFYCHELFPFKKSSVYQVFPQVIAIVLLLVKSFVNERRS